MLVKKVEQSPTRVPVIGVTDLAALPPLKISIAQKVVRIPDNY